MSGLMAMVSSARKPEHFGNPVNMIMVGQMRSWLRKQFKAESTLVIERLYHGPLLGTRNRVALRVTFPDAIGGEVEVGWLYTLREKRLGPDRSRQCIIAKFGERERDADQRTVA